MGLATHSRDLRISAEGINDDAPQEPAPESPEQPADDGEAFLLDDTEIADRLSPNRAKPTTASTPPHAHLMFPMLGRLVR
jgi:hypothetical protein